MLLGILCASPYSMWTAGNEPTDGVCSSANSLAFKAQDNGYQGQERDTAHGTFKSIRESAFLRTSGQVRYPLSSQDMHAGSGRGFDLKRS